MRRRSATPLSVAPATTKETLTGALGRIVDGPEAIEAQARRYARETAALRAWELEIEVERLRDIMRGAAEDRRGLRYRRAAADLDTIFVAGAHRRVCDPEIVRLRRQSRVDGVA